MPRVSQSPDGSILPSAVLGAGAARSGLPSGVRGIPGVGCVNHCAEAEAAVMNATRPATTTRVSIDLLGRMKPSQGDLRIAPRHGCAATKEAGGLGPEAGSQRRAGLTAQGLRAARAV